MSLLWAKTRNNAWESLVTGWQVLQTDYKNTVTPCMNSCLKWIIKQCVTWNLWGHACVKVLLLIILL